MIKFNINANQSKQYFKQQFISLKKLIAGCFQNKYESLMSPSKWLYHAFPQKLCVGEFNSVVRVIQGITFSLFEASKKKKKKKKISKL